MGRDREQRFRQFPDRGNEEVLNVLGSQDHNGVPLTDTLHGIADVLDTDPVGQIQVELIDGCHRVADADQRIGHVGQDIEQHCITKPFIGIHETLNTEAHELVIDDVGVAIEVPAFRTNTHGVQSQTDLSEHLFGVQVLLFRVEVSVLPITEPVQIFQNRIVRGTQLGEVRGIRNHELLIELLQQDFQGVDLGIRESLIGAEEVFQECDVLRQSGRLLKSFRAVQIIGIIRIVMPHFRLEDVDDVLTREQVQVGTAQLTSQIPVLIFHIQTDHSLARFTKVGQQKLHQEGFALTRVTQDDGVAVGLIFAATIQINQDVGAELISANVESLRVCFAREVKGKQVGNRTCRQHSFVLGAEAIGTERNHRQEAFLLAQGQPIHRDLGTSQFHGNVRLQHTQCLGILGFQFDVHRTVQQGLPVLTQVGKQCHNILQVTLCLDRFIQIVVASLQLVSAVGIIHDLPLLHGFYQTVVDSQSHTIAVCQLGQDRLFLRGGRIFSNRPCTAVGVSHHITVCKEFDRAGRDTVKEIFCPNLFLLLFRQHFLLSFEYTHQVTSLKC